MTPGTPLRVLATRRLLSQDLEYLRAKTGPAVEIVIPPDFTDEAILAAAGDADVLLGNFVSRALLERHGARLRLIQIPWTGVDSLDFALLREFRPVVANSHTNAFAVAEHTVALLLAVMRAIPLHDRDLRRGLWHRPEAGPVSPATAAQSARAVAPVPTGAAPDRFIPPVSLQGAEVVIAGYGAIGAATARLLAAFGPTLRAWRRRPADRGPAETASAASASAPEPLAQLAGPESRLALAARADAVILTLPLTPGTRHIVDREFLAAMRPTASLVNVGRGELIADDALYDALASGAIAGAALDTWWKYPSASDPNPLPNPRFPFHELDNVVMSPHRAGFERDALPHLAGAAENLNRLAAGLPPENVVDLDHGY